ncbi:MAG: FKBP-type peptidyl-prolyl cis-trans isomerase [Prevotella sp.]|nr:FKBP-type peptidyl-prolyl cis-trans isomerase [Prevotella sp.]
MRKIALFAVAAIVVASSISCGKGQKANLKSDVDTISYAIGLINGGQLKDFLASQGMDSTYIADFLKGFKEGSKSVGDKKKEAYLMGMSQGMQMTNGLNNRIFGGEEGDGQLSVPNMIAGLMAGVKNDTTIFNPMEIQTRLEGMISTVHSKAMEKKYEKNKEEGAKFLAEKANDKDVKKLANGVMYKVLKEGTGATPDSVARVKVNYEGKLIDGTVFDSSYQRGQPAEMGLNMLVPGFAEALRNMPVGSEWEIYIPADQGYGEREAGNIKPFSTLIFKVELLEILKK